jgi:hypothetical protein
MFFVGALQGPKPKPLATQVCVPTHPSELVQACTEPGVQ